MSLSTFISNADTSNSSSKEMDLFLQKHKKSSAPQPSKYNPLNNVTYNTQQYANVDYSNRADAIKRLQSFAKRKSSADGLVTLNEKSLFYSDEFRDFVGEEIRTVKRSTNLEKAKELAEAVKAGNWNASILAISPDVLGSALPYPEILQTATQVEKGLIKIPFNLALKENAKKFDAKELFLILVLAFSNNTIYLSDFNFFVEEFKLYERLNINSTISLTNESLELSEDAERLFHEFQNDPTVNIDKLRIELDQLKNYSKPVKTILDEIRKHLDGLPVSPHLYYALTAYAAGLITRDQIDNILVRHDLAQHCGAVTVIPIINEKGEFTTEIAPYLEKLFQPEHFSQERLEQFRKNLLCVSESERFLFIANYSGLTQHYNDESFANIKLSVGVSTDMDNQTFLILANGAADALGVAVFGHEQKTKALARLGLFSPLHIRQSVHQGARYRATAFPRTKHTFYVHNALTSRLVGGFMHDTTHIGVMSSIPKSVNDSLDETEKLAVDAAQMDLSKEIWDIIDRNFSQLLGTNPDIARAKNTKINFFYEILLNVSGIKKEQLNMDISELSGLNTSDSFPLFAQNVTLLAFALGITQSPERWAKNDIQIEDLQSYTNLKVLLDNAKSIKDEIKNDPFPLQVIKLAFYSHFHHLNQLENGSKQLLFSLLDQAYGAKKVCIFKRKPGNFLKVSYLEENNPVTKKLSEFMHFLKQKLTCQTVTTKEIEAAKMKF